METIMVEIGALQAHPMNPRSEQALTANTEALASSLSRGVHKPLTVRSIGDGTYQILAGHRTAYVAQSMGFAELPCIIVEADDVAALKIVIGDNAAVESITTCGVIDSIRALLAAGVSKKEVFQIVGLSKARCNDLLRLGSMDPSILAALEQSEITKDNKLTASTLIAVGRVKGFDTVAPEKALELITGKSRRDATSAIERWIKGEAERVARVAAHEAGEPVPKVAEPKVRAPRTSTAKAAERKAEKAAEKRAEKAADNGKLQLACARMHADLSENGFRLAPEADIIVGRVLAGPDIDEAGALFEALDTLFELGIMVRH